MTVSQQTPVSNCWGNNSATEFSFNFYIAKESELLVEHTDLNGIKSTLENGVDYSIHEIGNKDGSYITFPLSGSKYKTLAWDTSTDKKELLTISLTLPIEQSAEYEDSGDLSKKNLELSFDYAIRLIQILNRTISRAVKVNEGDEVTPDQLIESLNESKRIAVDAATTATTQAENAQNSANIASEKANIATAKTAEVTETYNNAMADIQKDWQDAIAAIEEKQSTAETSIADLQSNAETVISNGIADITSNKEQSMSAIDENRENTLAEIESAKSGAVLSVNTTKDNAVSTVKQTGTDEYNKILSTGIDSKLGENQITNCLLEVPQRIKYTLVDGTLTIKAGSVVIVPYGTEDKTADLPKGATFINENFKVYDTQYTEDSEGNGKFFVWAELVNDVSCDSFSEKQNVLLFMNTANQGTSDSSIGQALSTKVGSGTSDPKTGYYYQTEENKVYHLGNFYGYSLPFALSTGNGTTLTSIDQVFNGIGYMGSTAWFDKNVTCLMSGKGKNPQGQLINKKWTSEKLITATGIFSGNNLRKIFVTESHRLVTGVYVFKADAPPPIDSTQVERWYNTEENRWYIHLEGETTWTISDEARTLLQDIQSENGQIVSWKNKKIFQAADEQDIDGNWVIVDVKLAASGTTIKPNETKVFDLSSILPNDGNLYEILLSGGVSTAATAGNCAYLYVQSDFYQGGSLVLARVITRTASTMTGGGTVLIPVGGSRTVKIWNTNNAVGNGNIFINLIAYRKAR